MSGSSQSKTIVLLIDDQPMIGEGLRRMLAGQTDIEYHYCNDPRAAITRALELKPTVILLELVLHHFDGLALLKELRSHSQTSEIPLLILSAREDPNLKAAAFAAGGNDYLIKFPERTELLARVRHHSRGYINFLERNAAYVALEKSQAALTKDIKDAADYVRSLLPPPMKGAISTHWAFITSNSLGGDSFGYHWLDENNFAIYLLDVCGHGVGAALFSVSAMNLVRSQDLPVNFCEPGAVLGTMNEAFPMEKQNDMYISIWYGVFNKTNRSLVYSSAGHPPAVLISRDKAEPETSLLATPGLAVGSMPGLVFATGKCEIPRRAILYLFSDGAIELNKGNEGRTGLQEFLAMLATPLQDPAADLDRIKSFAQTKLGGAQFEDDFSVLRIDFD